MIGLSVAVRNAPKTQTGILGEKVPENILVLVF